MGMRRITIDAGRYQSSAQTAPVADEKTVCYVFGKVIAREYGQRGATQIVPRRVIGSTLYVAVVSALWAQEVWDRRQALVAAVNERCGDGRIRTIRVDVAV